MDSYGCGIFFVCPRIFTAESSINLITKSTVLVDKLFSLPYTYADFSTLAVASDNPP